MRYLAIDLGDKRTGLATGDDATGIVSPVGMIETTDPDLRLRKIIDAIAEHLPDQLIVGIPYNMDATPGPAARKAQQFADQLAEATGLTVHRADERLTSYQADDAMKQSGLTHKKKKQRRDALAAAAILRDFLAAR